MDVQEVLSGVKDAVTVKRVYGDPCERDGVTIIPAAVVGGGGGGGGDNEGNGGSGFGVGARPVGAFVIKDGTVRWEPAVDVTRLAIIGLVALLIFRSLVRGRARRRARARKARK